jgi:hypothetical protein
MFGFGWIPSGTHINVNLPLLAYYFAIQIIPRTTNLDLPTKLSEGGMRIVALALVMLKVQICTLVQKGSVHKFVGIRDVVTFQPSIKSLRFYFWRYYLYLVFF